MKGLEGLSPEWILLGCLSLIVIQGLGVLLFSSYQKRRTARAIEQINRQLASGAAHFERQFSELRQLQRELVAQLREKDREAPEAAVSKREGPKTVLRGLDKKHQVLRLARQGLSIEAISQKLNLYRGETELLLGLGRYFNQPELDEGRRVSS